MEEGSVQSVGHPEVEGLCRTKILRFLKVRECLKSWKRLGNPICLFSAVEFSSSSFPWLQQTGEVLRVKEE